MSRLNDGTKVCDYRALLAKADK